MTRRCMRLTSRQDNGATNERKIERWEEGEGKRGILIKTFDSGERRESLRHRWSCNKHEVNLFNLIMTEYWRSRKKECSKKNRTSLYPAKQQQGNVKCGIERKEQEHLTQDKRSNWRIQFLEQHSHRELNGEKLADDSNRSSFLLIKRRESLSPHRRQRSNCHEIADSFPHVCSKRDIFNDWSDYSAQETIL